MSEDAKIKKVTILAGSQGKDLARRLSHSLHSHYMDPIITRFADQELRIQLPCPFYGHDVIVVQSTCNPANDHLMELLLLVDAAKRAGGRRIIAVIPYFGYSRQDRPSYEWGPISARLITSMLEAAGVDHVVTLDLHSKQMEGFFKIHIQNLDALSFCANTLLQAQWLKTRVVVSPDIGGIPRARKVADLLQCGLCVIDKSRPTEGGCQSHTIIGKISQDHCIIIDDIVDTGGTLFNACQLLEEHGAKHITAIIPHAVLSANAVEKLKTSALQSIITTNSIPQILETDFFTVVDVEPLIRSSLQHLLDH